MANICGNNLVVLNVDGNKYRLVWPPEPTCMNSAGLKLRMGFAALIP